MSVCRAPDLTKDPSETHAVHVPFQASSSFPEREGARRRQPIARLHCRAFHFPVSLSHSMVGLYCMLAPKVAERCVYSSIAYMLIKNTALS